MNLRVGEKQIEKAKRVHLQKYLMSKLNDLIRKDVSTDRYHYSKDKDIYILDRGFISYKSGKRGDQIQFLEDFAGKTFQDAVCMLASYADSYGAFLLEDIEIQKNSNPDEFEMPKAINGLYKCVWSYLVKRRQIPPGIVGMLFEKKLLYQSEYCNNCVFSSNFCKYAELHGASDISFSGIVRNSERDGYWLLTEDISAPLYICKSAIDAISLYALFKEAYPDKAINVASTGGYKEDTVNRIINENIFKIVLAIDKTVEGEQLGDKFQNIPKVRPVDVILSEKKVIDWNDFLCYSPAVEEINAAFENITYVGDLPF